MIVMPANSNKLIVGYLAGKYPGRLGHLYSPGGFRGPYPFLPFGIDNGRFPCWQTQRVWDEGSFIGLLDRVMDTGSRPLWIVVPDVVADRDATLREWDKWAPRLKDYGWPLAMAVQDGMTPDDVPAEAKVIFVGGSTEWKKTTLHDWTDEFDNVHVGRVNSPKWLWECDRAGVMSCDGTGWFRGDKVQLAGLLFYLERKHSGAGEPQQHLFPSSGYWACPCGHDVGPSYAECPKCHQDRQRRES